MNDETKLIPLKEWVIWATNEGRKGGTCISPHIRCNNGNNGTFCNGCEYFEFCTVTSKRLNKK